jgi:hypothetical protein
VGARWRSATAAMLVLPKLLRSRLILIAAGWIPSLIGRAAIIRVLRICCATCGISFPFFNLELSIEHFANDKVLRFGGHVFLTYKLGVHKPTGITQCSGTCSSRSAEPTELSKGGTGGTNLRAPSAIRGLKSHCIPNRFAPLVQAPRLSKPTKQGGKRLSLMEVNGVTCLSLRSHITFFGAPRIRPWCLSRGYRAR